MRKNSSVLLHTLSYSNLNGNITLITRKRKQPSDGMLVSLHQSKTVAFNIRYWLGNLLKITFRRRISTNNKEHEQVLYN